MVSRVDPAESNPLIEQSCLLCAYVVQCRRLTCCGTDNYVCDVCIKKQLNSPIKKKNVLFVENLYHLL